MSDDNRRDFLKKSAGAAFVAGGLLTASGAVTGDGGSESELPDELPDLLPEADATEDWASYRADAGNTHAVDSEYEFDADTLEIDWTFDENVSIAISDGTVYARTDSDDGGFLHALEAETGDERWRTDEIVDLGGTPTVAYDTVFVGGSEVRAFDLDGSLRWETTFEPEESVTTPTVAYGAVFVVVDGSLYALEVDDGSVRWARDTVDVHHKPTSEDYAVDLANISVAAANGLVYAGARFKWDDYLVAIEAGTGEVVRDQMMLADLAGPIVANENAVGVRIPYEESVFLRDPLTGEGLGSPANMSGLALGEDVLVTAWRHDLTAYDFEAGETLWTWRSDDLGAYPGGSPTIVGDTVLFSLDDQFDEFENTIVAFDLYDGTVEWTLEMGDHFPSYVSGDNIAVSDETLYVASDSLLALRATTEDEDDGQDGDEDGQDSDGDDEEDGQDGDEDDEEDSQDGQDGDEDDGEDGTVPDDC
ncbi:PQQ-binding-like beta-propeller repeat protein [Natrononativus amylolyticus]|uniref:outer membrane protein assembly factor BamB family protein n=1 Tax=Natrononativus amylolyticus TaxID=2963434 RepID=UPI0020CDBD29|nr:PQQ-binding-like beta-propeller repeat protein [Natrononativus amylolyticus]